MKRKTYLIFLLAGVLLVTASIWLTTAPPTQAQCGSQASSCKNCHEVQAQYPVNADGTAWHQSHAFGDFCYICHAGNQQDADKTAAHTGLVPPLSDIKASCLQCHPSDLEERAQVYATALGVEIGAGGASSGTSDTTAAATTSDTTSQPAVVSSVPAAVEIDYDDPDLVDYVARYNEIVLGQKPTNWGNTILLVMIGLVAVGGGGYVINHEKLINVSFGETKKVGNEYPAEVVDMLPALTHLNNNSRKALKHVLENPKADKVLGLMDAVVSDEKVVSDETVVSDKTNKE
ncbi:MAG: hypothetical protein H6636_03940 [Anaerolineales bacterium]|nr:hypothetical protein [Anaerolineales bacterium]